MGRKRKKKEQSFSSLGNKNKQKGKGRPLSFSQSPANINLGKRNAAKLRMKKSPSALKKRRGKVKQRHTQVPNKDGFISLRLRKRPTTRPTPPTGIVNNMPTIGERPGQLKTPPEQLAWGI